MLLKAALNGARTRADHPAIPLTPDEQAREAIAAVAAGAGALCCCAVWQAEMIRDPATSAVTSPLLLMESDPMVFSEFRISGIAGKTGGTCPRTEMWCNRLRGNLAPGCRRRKGWGRRPCQAGFPGRPGGQRAVC